MDDEIPELLCRLEKLLQVRNLIAFLQGVFDQRVVGTLLLLFEEFVLDVSQAQGRSSLGGLHLGIAMFEYEHVEASLKMSSLGFLCYHPFLHSRTISSAR